MFGKFTQNAKLVCSTCSREFSRSPSQVREGVNYCSKKCYGAAKVKTRKLECQVCGNGFERKPSRMRGDSHFCGVKCYRASRKGRLLKPLIQLACDWCNKNFERKPKDQAFAERRGSNGAYCSIDCANAAKTLKDLTVNYKTSRRSNLRQQMIRCGLVTACERCDYCNNPNILQVHHKDRNNKNNDPGNLEILCPNCHAEEHWGEGRAYFKEKA